VKIALATCAKLPEPDVDEELLVAALRQRHLEVRLAAWDRPEDAIAAGEVCIVRSTWNYYRDVDAFLAWVGRTPRILNSAQVIRWNAKKTYLRELEAAGIPIVPTAWDHPRTLPWETVVIKPVVSAGSFATRRFTRAEEAEARQFLAEAGREMMVQQWMPAVDSAGERSLVWIRGAGVTHAIRKSPRFADGQESVTSVPVADDERAFADRVVARVDGHEGLLYARIDMIRDGDTLRLMELELIEPSLFLKQHPPALERFANAIAEIR
jgi:glutathione synthase/RimK-type ligase-like ATP-grasp enzyme